MPERLQEGFGGKKIEFQARVPMRNAEGYLIGSQQLVRLTAPVVPSIHLIPKPYLPSRVRL